MGQSIYFNVSDNKDIIESNSFDPIPSGKYQAIVSEAEVKETKAGNGKYLNLQLKIVGEKYEGRVIFDMINFENSSQKAEVIGKAKLGKLVLALGLDEVTDTDDLLGITIGIKVSVEHDDYKGEKVNKIKDYLHKDSVE